MEGSKGIDVSNLPSIYSKRKTRKCSSCKCLKPMDQFLPITINKKTVIPKTCQYCRSRRNSYYWNFESKKPKTESHKNTATSADKLTPMPIGYIEKPANLNPPTPAFEPIQVDVPLPATMPTAASSLKRTSEEMMFSPMDSILTMHEALTPLDEDLKLREDELRSMLDFDNMTKQTVNTVNDTLPDEMNVNDILFELQRQTVHSMMDELVNISDILAASQLDVYSNNESDLPFLDLGFESFQAANEL